MAENEGKPVAQSGSPPPLLTIARYRIELRARDTIGLPDYAGSAWRGLFGHALKRTVCVTRQRECSQCLLYSSCIYSYIFDTPPPPGADRMRRYTAVPHPFVIVPGTARAIEAGARFSLGFTLFGRAIGHLPYLIHALATGGEHGIGRGDGRYEIETVCQETSCGSGKWRKVYRPGGSLDPDPQESPEAPDPPAHMILKLVTPLRLKRDERLVNTERFTFHDLLMPLLRRIAMLMYFHGDTELDVDFASLGRAARAVRFNVKRLAWQDWTRYSSRQGTTLQMGGLTGELSLDGRDIEPFWPCLWLGQWTHAGKGATMGLGRYVIEAASLPDGTGQA